MPPHPRTPKHLLPALAAAIALAASTARADIIPTGDVSPTNPSTWTTSTTSYVGKTSIGTVTVNAGSTLLSDIVYLGNNIGAAGTITVDGTGSSWTNKVWLFIGNSGTGTLNITNGGSVSSLHDYIGYNSGSIGTVTVSGTSSTWTESGLLVGFFGSGALNIVNGGNVRSSDNYHYIGCWAGSTGVVTVDGLGSKWTYSGSLLVGDYGNGIMTITNGGNVTSNSSIYIGEGSGINGTVTVDGANSTWNNTGSLYLGGALFAGDTGNGTLNITNGGKMVVTGTVYVAYNGGTTGSINFSSNGGTLTAQSLYAAPSQINGTGTIYACGLVSDVNLIFDATHGLNQTLVWNGANQNVTINLDLTGASGPVGDLGAGNQGNGTLTISDGMKLTAVNGILGYYAGSTGIAIVSGSGSTWTNTGSLIVGNYGAGTLSITNGGNVSSGATSYLGNNAGATGTLVVEGTSSTYTNSGDLYVGTLGNGALNITNGGQVTMSGTTFVASNSLLNFGANGGTLTTQSLCSSPLQVTGVGTIYTRGLVSDINLLFDATHGLNQTLVWNGANQNVNVNLDITGVSGIVGALGAGNQGAGTLTITDGVKVMSASGLLGNNAGSTGIATVTGSGSTWINSSLVVGNSGNGTLNVTNGGSVSSFTVYLGNNVGSTGTAYINGTGSTLAASSTLYIGYIGTGRLNISNGGYVSTKYVYEGYNSLGSVGTATIDGSGSMLIVGSILYIGNFGSGVLNITNGGKVSDDISYISYYGNGSVTVDGAGSMWTNSGSLIIANQANGTMTITNGGLVSDSSSYVGPASGSGIGSGAVTVAGIGSTWTNSSTLAIGNYGNGTLTITNGGKVSNTAASLGGLPFGQGAGAATIDGAGSMWTNSGSLTIGGYGNGTLTITNGGKVSNTAASLGGLPSGQGAGAATIDGAGSMWTNSGSLTIGNHGNGTLTITNGGQVSNTAASLGGLSSGQGAGAATIDGAGSMWTNSGSLTIGNYGNGTLTIINGGKVGNTAASLGGLSFGQGAGAATIDGAGSTWTNSSTLAIGNYGNGTLTIINGGMVSNTAASLGGLSFGQGAGAATIDGAGSTWTNSSTLAIGNYGNGTLTIINGGMVSNTAASLGGLSSGQGAGAATIDGAGSMWTNSGSLTIGNHGNGTLTITNGGQVSDTLGSVGGFMSGNSSGAVTVAGIGSTWTNSGALYVGSSGPGTLNITNGGLVTSPTGVVGNSATVTGTAIVDGSGSTWTNSGSLIVGNSGTGTLNITNAGQVSSATGVVGSSSGATGVVTVAGSGSTWTNSSTLYVGYRGAGTLKITNGGKVTVNNNSLAYLAYTTGSTGTATVDGAGSTWTNSGTLYVGYSGPGTLTISNGASVTAGGASIYRSTSLLALNVGDASSLNCGTGSFTNSGTLRLKAVPGLAPGTYSPINAGSWIGSGTTQALGGVWSITSHSFIVTPAVTATAGQPVSINLLQTQRITITDPTANCCVQAAFQSTTVTTNLTLSALTLTPTLSTLLQNNLPANTNILAGWTLTPTNYTPGTPAFLSLQIGPNQSLPTLALWHYDNNTWSPYSAPDLSYDGTYANFTVTNFSAYAVTAQVPEPAPLALLALGLAPLLLPRRRRNAGVPPAARPKAFP